MGGPLAPFIWLSDPHKELRQTLALRVNSSNNWFAKGLRNVTLYDLSRKLDVKGRHRTIYVFKLRCQWPQVSSSKPGCWAPFGPPNCHRWSQHKCRSFSKPWIASQYSSFNLLISCKINIQVT